MSILLVAFTALAASPQTPDIAPRMTTRCPPNADPQLRAVGNWCIPYDIVQGNGAAYYEQMPTQAELATQLEERVEAAWAAMSAEEQAKATQAKQGLTGFLGLPFAGNDSDAFNAHLVARAQKVNAYDGSFVDLDSPRMQIAMGDAVEWRIVTNGNSDVGASGLCGGFGHNGYNWGEAGAPEIGGGYSFHSFGKQLFEQHKPWTCGLMVSRKYRLGEESEGAGTLGNDEFGHPISQLNAHLDAVVWLVQRYGPPDEIDVPEELWEPTRCPFYGPLIDDTIHQLAKKGTTKAGRGGSVTTRWDIDMITMEDPQFWLSTQAYHMGTANEPLKNGGTWCQAMPLLGTKTSVDSASYEFYVRWDGPGAVLEFTYADLNAMRKRYGPRYTATLRYLTVPSS